MLRLSVLIAIFIAVAPAVSAQPVSDSALVAQIYDDLARGDVAAVAAVLDPHVIWIEDADGPQAQRHFGPGTVALFVLRPQVDAGTADVPDAISTRRGRVLVVGTTRRRDPETHRLGLASFTHGWRVVDGRVVSVERSARRSLNTQAIERQTPDF